MRELLAAPVIRQDRDVIGAPAKTDFIHIYICDDVTPHEYAVLLKHEQSHIWLAHNRRFKKDMVIKKWDIACEIEIARNIYSDSDIEVIKSPMSRIKGGYVPDTIKDMPHDLLLAEEIYEWLLENEQDQSPDCKCCDHSMCGGGEDISPEDMQQVIEGVKEHLEALVKSEVAQKNTALNIKEIQSRRPTLTSELESLLRRRVERDRSFRRPSRIESADIIKRGRITTQNAPLVEIFIDRSGSFTQEKTAKAQIALANILNKYHSSIKNDVWFFGSGQISSTDFNGGNTPYHLIYEHIKLTSPKVAIVITDDDVCCDFVPAKGNKTRVIVIPVGCSSTDFFKKIPNGIEVSV